jgi:hypothetical protein
VTEDLSEEDLDVNEQAVGLRTRFRFSGAETGRGLIGLLVAIALLGVMGSVLLVTQTGPTSRSDRAGGGTTINSSPSRGALDIHAAGVAACHANYEAATAAASYYQTLYGKPPTNVNDLRSIFRDFVSSNRFSITIDPTHPGLVEVAANGHPAQPGSGNCAYAG